MALRVRIDRPWRRLVAGLAVAAGILAAVEGGAHLVLGTPHQFNSFDVLSRCAVVAQGDQVALACNQDRLLRSVPRDHPGRPRVVVLGESSMWEPVGQSVADRLSALLPEVEVVNFAVPGLQVASIAGISHDLHVATPDLVLIYAGHNEYSRTVFLGGVSAPRLWLLPFYGVLRHSWIHAWLMAPHIERADHLRARPPVLATEDDLALRLQPEIERAFRYELRAAVRASPAPVLLCTLLRNPDAPPSGVLVRGHPACEPHLSLLASPTVSAQALAALERDCGETSLLAYERYVFARARGDQAAAVAAWHRSMELDPLPLRAPMSADDIIREVAAQADAELVDLAAELGPLPDPGLFSDTIHFSEAGTRRLAEHLAPRIRRQLAIPAVQ